MYRLISDDNERWFVIPVGKEDEAVAYLAAEMNYWFDVAEGTRGGVPAPARPEWMVAVGPELITFPSYTIGD